MTFDMSSMVVIVLCGVGNHGCKAVPIHVTFLATRLNHVIMVVRHLVKAPVRNFDSWLRSKSKVIRTATLRSRKNKLVLKKIKY